MKRGFKIVRNIFVIIIVLSGLGAVAYYRYKEKIGMLGQKKVETLETSVPVAVTRVKVGTITESLTLYGGVEPISEVNIFSTVPGKIKNILFKEGDRVKKNAVLAYIDRSEAGLTYALAPVESTIDGVIKKILVENGASVSPAVPLFQIIDMDQVEIHIHVPEKDISRVREGLETEVKIISYPGKKFFGKVYKLLPVVDPLTRTREATILLNNENHLLKPGMFGEVKLIIREKKNATIIPFSAMIERDGKSIIFIVNDGKAVQVNPIIDIEEGERISVTSGVKSGDKVIVIGQHNVDTGDMVTITEEIE